MKVCRVLLALSLAIAPALAQQTTITATVNVQPVTQASFFGADFNSFKTWPPTDGNGEAAKLAGIRLWDNGVKWGQINTSRGAYVWTKIDQWMQKAQQIGADVLYTFGDTPQFAAPTTPPAGCNAPGPYSCAAPADVNADGSGTDKSFSDFVTQLVTRYKGQIAFYELWNEPDCKCFFAGTQAQLVRMSKDAAGIIRKLDPKARILSPSAHGPTMATWFDAYILAGGAPYFDIVNVHMRGQGSSNVKPETFLSIYSQVIAEVKKRNLTGRPIWDDEHGALPGQVSDIHSMAAYVARELILRASVGIPRQYVYTWDHSQFPLQGTEAGTAWNNVAQWLTGHSIAACNVSRSLYSCQSEKNVLLWDTLQTCSSSSCSTRNQQVDPKFKNYLRIDGSSAAIVKHTVPVGAKPIMLTQ